MAFDLREAMAGDELYSVEGGWTHTREGRLLRESGWMAHEVLDAVDVARPPGARTSYDTVIQDGIGLLRLPLARLGAGTTDIAAVNLSGAGGDVESGLRIGVELTSAPGHP